jgi:hypothetical protein
MNALCCQKVWDPSSALTWQHAFSVSGVTLAANRLPKPGKTHSRRVSQCGLTVINRDKNQDKSGLQVFCTKVTLSKTSMYIYSKYVYIHTHKPLTLIAISFPGIPSL